jgi:hypothetical protein
MLLRLAYVIIDLAKLIIQYFIARQAVAREIGAQDVDTLDVDTREDDARRTVSALERHDCVDEAESKRVTEKIQKDIASKQIELMSRQIELEVSRLRHQANVSDKDKVSMFSMLKGNACIIIVGVIAIVVVFDRFDIVSLVMQLSHFYLEEIRKL